MDHPNGYPSERPLKHTRTLNPRCFHTKKNDDEISISGSRKGKSRTILGLAIYDVNILNLSAIAYRKKIMPMEKRWDNPRTNHTAVLKDV